MPEMNRPNIRFKNDNGTEYPLYSLASFSEVLSIERGSSPRPIQKYLTNDADGLNWIKIGDAPVNGTRITAVKEKIKKSGLSKTRFVKKGDLILSNSMSFGRPYLLAVDGCIHDGWLLIRNSHNKFIVEFLLYLLSSPNILRQYKSLAGAGVVTNLNKELVSKVILAIPSLEEQQKIASFFSTLDQKIELNERKLEALEKLKKELMHQIFNRKIRFKEKDGTEFPEWASSTLGDEVQFAKGGKLGKKDLRENGAFPCLLYGELYTFYKCIASTIISRTNISSDNRSKKNDVVIPTSGETAEDIATATCIPHDGVLYGGDLLILRSKSLYGPFLSYLINSSLKRKISRLAQGKSVVHIGADKIKTIEFQFPCTKEQQKIANFLSSFDQKIDVIEKRIEAMRKLKFGFMQQMFV